MIYFQLGKNRFTGSKKMRVIGGPAKRFLRQPQEMRKNTKTHKNKTRKMKQFMRFFFFH